MTTKQYLINESELMKDWDLDENQDLNPADLLVGSNKRAAWICNLCNNKWKTAIYHRAINKTGCRKCSSKKRLSFNINESIFKTHPDIAKDWSPDKNGRLTPKMFSKNSRYEANWRCHICGVETTTRRSRLPIPGRTPPTDPGSYRSRTDPGSDQGNYLKC